MRRRRPLLPLRWLWLLGVLLIARPVAAQVPADDQARILVRALAYDANLKTRAGDALRIAVLCNAKSASSRSAADGIVGAFRKLSNFTVQGLAVQVQRIDYENEAALTAAIESGRIGALYVGPGLDSAHAAIRGVSRARRIITMAGDEAAITGGLALGVVAIDNLPKIIVNLPASREEGAAFSGELLRLAKVLK